jgi:prephenate dehydratase
MTKKKRAKKRAKNGAKNGTKASKRGKIAFQGEPGANSQIACRQGYPDYAPLPCATFEDAFAAVRSGRAALAMIPIDNSVAGRVADIHHLMPASQLHIVAEWFLPVQHQLVAPRGAMLRTIRTVESHIHALGQCRNVIRKLGVKPVVAADTAGAAREVAEAGDITRAALATKLAAKIYGLRILKKDVADAKHNTTRFIVLAREPKWAGRKEKRVVTTFIFQVRNIPAALYKALGGFATNGVNMTKLESYMVNGSFAATQFYVDVQGHPKQRALELALEELEFVSQPKSLKILGVYPGHRLRDTFK